MPCNGKEMRIIHLFPDLRHLLIRPAVSPDDGAPERPALAVNREASHHLTAETDRRNVVRRNRTLLQQFPGSHADRAPPVIRILFRSVSVTVERIALHRVGDHPPVL